MKLSSFLISIAVLFGLLGVSHGGKLSLDYYKDTCPQALDIVREVTWKHVEQDLTVAAPLLRLHCHDCFIRVIHVFLLYIIHAQIYLYSLLSYIVKKKKKLKTFLQFTRTYGINFHLFFLEFAKYILWVLWHKCIWPLKFKMWSNIFHITFMSSMFLKYIYPLNYMLGLWCLDTDRLHSK